MVGGGVFSVYTMTFVASAFGVNCGLCVLVEVVCGERR
jgi:hypothetical protein